MLELFDHLIKVAKVEEGKSHAQVINDAPTTHFHGSETTQDVGEILTQVLFDYLVSSTVNVDNPTLKQIQELKTLCIKYVASIRFDIVRPSMDVYDFHTFMGRILNSITPDDLSGVYTIANNLIGFSIPMIPITNSTGNYVMSSPDFEPFSISPSCHVVMVCGREVPDIIMFVQREEASK